MKEDGSSTRSLVQTAGMKPKFHSNLMAADLFTVKSVLRNIGRKDISRGMHRNPGMVFSFIASI
jgi:hypothetical protein